MIYPNKQGTRLPFQAWKKGEDESMKQYQEPLCDKQRKLKTPEEKK